MKDIKLDLSSVKDVGAKFGKNLSWLFFAAFLLVVVFEIFEIKNSVDIALNVNQAPIAVQTQKGVRINFDAYNQALSRIQEAQNFTPSATTTPDPFSVPPPAGPQ